MEEISDTQSFFETSERYLENAVFKGNIFVAWQFWACVIIILTIGVGTYFWLKKRKKDG
jgi:hypothetical protein